MLCILKVKTNFECLQETMLLMPLLWKQLCVWYDAILTFHATKTNRASTTLSFWFFMKWVWVHRLLLIPLPPSPPMSYLPSFSSTPSFLNSLFLLLPSLLFALSILPSQQSRDPTPTNRVAMSTSGKTGVQERVPLLQDTQALPPPERCKKIRCARV